MTWRVGINEAMVDVDIIHSKAQSFGTVEIGAGRRDDRRSGERKR